MKKTLMLLVAFITLITLSACGSTVKCGTGTILEDGACIADLGETVKEVKLVSGKSLSFEVGDTLPDFTMYFEMTDVTIEASMITHDIILDASNVMTTEGTYTITVLADDVTKTFTLTVAAEGTTIDDNITPGVASISLKEGKVLVFEVGDTFPNFLEYFTAYDGTNVVAIPAENILHDLLLDANNIITTEGSFSVEVTVGSIKVTFPLTVVAEGTGGNTVDIPEVAGIYLVANKKIAFEIGDTFPGFATYFKVSDGTALLSIDGNNVLHNILMNDNNIMTTAGTYTVSYTHSIGMIEYSKEFTITVGGTSGETVDTSGWEMTNGNFTDETLNGAWKALDGDMTITFDNTAGEVDVLVNNIGAEFWSVIFSQGGKTYEPGYTYTVTYKLKTDISGGRNVVLFVEPATGVAKVMEEEVALTNVYQEFTYDFSVTGTTSTGMVGLFAGANLTGSAPGSIIIESVLVTRSGSLIDPSVDSKLSDLPNNLFTDSDISDWGIENNVTLSHDAAGYLVANVSAFTGNFWEENIQLGGFFVEANTEYTVEFVVKTGFAAGRDVTFFIEDTNGGFKYVETVETLTSTFATYTFTFTPTVDNEDTKLGLFLGDMANAVIGEVIIDSIVVTEN